VPERFEISTTASGKPWADVDKSAIWKLLKQGLDDGADGAADAIREVYAAVKAPVNKDLAEADCWGPHHEVREDGTVVLNRSGLIAAAAALAGARSSPDLTSLQREQARQHLLKHYEELELEPPESLSGEMVRVTATVCGEMSVSEIPVSPAVDMEALKEGDEDPLEVVVEIPAGRSKRGWDYLPRALQDIVDVVNAEGLPGYSGHQAPGNVDWEFRTPVTHWVGAIWRDGSAYFRGLIDKAAADLKRWIRGGTVKTVSIWGMPKLAYENGETKVIGYEPLSIDWTPPRRAGMPTQIVAMGEMDSIPPFGEMDGSLEDLSEALGQAAGRKLRVDGTDRWCWVERTYESYVIVSYGGKGVDRKLYKFDYAVDGDKVILGNPVEVELKRVYEPVSSGEMDTGGEGKVTWKELIAQLKPMLDSKEVTLGQVIGEMGLTAQVVAGEMADVKTAMDAAATLAQVREALGVSGEMDVVQAAKTAAEAVTAQAQATHDAMVDEVVAEKVKGEMAQDLVRRILVVPVGATKEQVAGEIDKLLGDDKIKAALSKLYTDQPVPMSNGGTQQSTSLRTKRQAI